MRTAWAALAACAFSICATLVVSGWAWRRRHASAAAWTLAAFTFCGTLWNAGHVVELIARDLRTKLIWDGLATFPAVAIGVLALMFACAYTSRRLPTAAIVSILVTLAPVTSYIALEPLVREPTTLRAAAQLVPPYGSLRYPLMFGDFVYLVQELILLVVAIGLLFARWLGQARPFRPQTAAVALALAIPTAFEYVWLFLGLHIQGEQDVGHVSCAIASLLLGWALARGRLFDLVPIARGAVFDNLDDVVLVLDRRRHIVDANNAATMVFERPLASLIGQPADVALGAWAALLPAAGREEPGAREVAAPAEAGKRWFDARWTPLDHSPSGVIGSTFVLHDITDVREARLVLEREVQRGSAALADSEGRFRALFDQTFQLSGVLDKRGTVLAMNRPALEMIGAEESALLGRPFWLTPWWSHSAEEQRRVCDAITRAGAGEFVRFETTHVDHQGKTRLIDFSLKPVRDGQGQITQLLPEGRDVTSLHEARERAATLAEQLRQAQKMEAIGRVAGGVAHDFNNLLIVISGSVGVAKLRLPADSELGPLLDEALQATTMAAGVVRQLLAFSRKQPIAPRHVVLGETLDQIDAILKRLVGVRMSLETQLPGDLWPVYIDPAQLQQVLINLVVNARDASPNGGTIAVRAENLALGNGDSAPLPGGRSGEFVRLSVSDTGDGMSDEVQSHMFEPFFTTKPEGSGTGLGLAVVHGVIHQGGGFIDVKSAPGRGTTFSLYLPRAS
jgi:PAS domain S-box-containing protein